jgi:hypothetical protein
LSLCAFLAAIQELPPSAFVNALGKEWLRLPCLMIFPPVKMTPAIDIPVLLESGWMTDNPRPSSPSRQPAL